MDPSLFQRGMQFNLPQPKSGGMFGGSGGKFGIGQALVAALNGYLASTAGPSQQVGMNNLQMMAEMRQRQMERQQSLDDYNRKRTDDNSDWQSHYQYKVDHPKEAAGSEYERLLTAAGIIPGTDAYHQHVTAKVNQLENPMVITPYGPMPYSAVNPAGPKPGDIIDDPRKQGGQAATPPAMFP